MKRSLSSLAVTLPVIIAAALMSSCTSVPVPKPAKDQPSVSSDEAGLRLKDGNARFVLGSRASKPSLARQRANLAEGQRPFAIIVGCADSRTSPEILFDQPLGSLFVVRSAGNLVEDLDLGSIEYAVEHLGARLVVVLGHERCGAVAAAVAGGHAPGHIDKLVKAISPAVALTKGKAGDAVENAMMENARRVAAQIRASKPSLKSLAHGEDVVVLPARYDLDTGVVTWPH